MKRKISWMMYLTALVVSILIFSLGILLGIQISQQATSQLRGDLEKLQLQSREIELLTLLQSDLLANNSKELCSIYSEQLKRFGDQTAEYGERLVELESKRGSSDPEAKQLRFEYSIMELRDFMLIKQTNENCGARISTILFFFSNENCPDCTKQVLALREIKNQRQEVQIYHLDMGLDAAIIMAFEKIYDVEKVPSLVVNGKTYEGFQSKNDILKDLS